MIRPWVKGANRLKYNCFHNYASVVVGDFPVKVYWRAVGLEPRELNNDDIAVIANTRSAHVYIIRAKYRDTRPTIIIRVRVHAEVKPGRWTAVGVHLEPNRKKRYFVELPNGN